MSKYFTFDNEPITGWTFFWRNWLAVLGLMLFVVPGLWIWAANGYKRAGSFQWSKEMRITSAIAVVLAQVNNILSRDPSYMALEMNLFDYIAIPCGILTFILLVKNGNLNKVVDSNNNTIIDESNEAVDVSFSPIEEDSTNNDNYEFDAKVKIIFNQFELDLNAENLNDYPVPYWYDIVKGRAESMKLGNSNKPIIDVQNEWTWMHADEYTTKYQSASKEDSIQAISLRIERFGFIYKILCALEKQLHDLVKEYNLETNPFLAQFDWDKASAAASLYGSINFALSVGMSNEDITKLYSDFVYDKDLINGADPFAALGATKEEAYSTIKEELGVDMDNVKGKKVKIKKKISSILSQLDLQKRYAVFTVLLQIANSDGVSSEENVILSDITLELEIDSNKYNDSNMDGGQACDLLQDLDQDQKDEISRLIVMIVGADGDFSSQEMMWVNDVIKELDLDISLLTGLMTKYWKK